MTWATVAITGHRRLPDGSHEWVQQRLAAAVKWLRDERGTTACASGMALGVDQTWARAVLDAGLQLHAYVPYPSQAAHWTDRTREQWETLIGKAHRVVFCSSTNPGDRGEAAAMLHQRNRSMLDDATAVVAVLGSGVTKGGTFNAVKYAEKLDLPGVILDPLARTQRWAPWHAQEDVRPVQDVTSLVGRARGIAVLAGDRCPVPFNSTEERDHDSYQS